MLIGWIRVARLDSIEDGASIRIETRDGITLVYRSGTRVFAVAERCPHAGGRLQSTLVDERTAVCPDHGYAFDLESGRCRAFRSLYADVYAARVIEGEVWLRVGIVAAIAAALRPRS